MSPYIRKQIKNLRPTDLLSLKILLTRQLLHGHETTIVCSSELAGLPSYAHWSPIVNYIHHIPEAHYWKFYELVNYLHELG